MSRDGWSTLLGGLAILCAAGGGVLAVLYAMDVRDEERAISVPSRALTRQARSAARQEQRLAELTFWQFEKDQREYERELARRRKARRRAFRPVH